MEPVGVECLVAGDCLGATSACEVPVCTQACTCDYVFIQDEPLCLSASDCDDDDPCTKDTCVATCACRNEPIPGCCQGDAACDDGDPCTKDTCTAGVCGWAANGLCAVPDCSPAGLTSIAEAWANAGSGALVKVAGVAGVDPSWLACDDQDCPAENPCCNNCSSGVALDDATGLVTLDSGIDIAWGCSSDSCGQQVACFPQEAGREHWAWGTIASPWGGVAEPDPGSPLVMWVEGWCLAMTPANVADAWQGTMFFEVGGQVPVRIELDEAADGGWLARVVQPEPCGGCAPSIETQAPVGAQLIDGRFYFETVITAPSGTVFDVAVQLYGSASGLQGRFGQYVSIPTALVPLPETEGWLALERAQP